MDKLNGVLCPMVTPLDENQNIDEQGTRKLVERLIKKGVNGIFLLGTQGEFPVLINKEKKRLVEIVADQVAARVPLLVNISDQGIRKAKQFYNMIGNCSFDAYILMPPGYYNVRDKKELINYYSYFVEILNKPVFIYDSKYTNNIIPDDVITELSYDPRIIGFKGPLLNHTQILRSCAGREDFSLFQADEANLDLALMLGADGIIPGICSFAADLCIELYKKSSLKDYEACKKLQIILHEIQSTVFGRQSQHWGNGHKYALSQLGICGDSIATTLIPLSEYEKKDIRKIIEKYNIS